MFELKTEFIIDSRQFIESVVIRALVVTSFSQCTAESRNFRAFVVQLGGLGVNNEVLLSQFGSQIVDSVGITNDIVGAVDSHVPRVVHVLPELSNLGLVLLLFGFHQLYL